MNQTQPDGGRRIGAYVLIAFGLFFLLAQVFDFSIFVALWPLLVILPGVPFLYAAYNGGKGQAGLIVPGSIISGTGLILLYQNITGHWESWAYAWLLYPVFLGLALQFMGRRTGDQGTYDTGSGFVRYGGTAFLVGAAIFELMIFGGGFLGGLALPALLICLGAFMLFRNRPSVSRSVKVKNDDLFTGARVVSVGSRNNGYSPALDPDLQRKIDAALAEEDDADEEKPKNG
jgi:hypothetical protein